MGVGADVIYIYVEECDKRHGRIHAWGAKKRKKKSKSGVECILYIGIDGGSWCRSEIMHIYIYDMI